MREGRSAPRSAGLRLRHRRELHVELDLAAIEHACDAVDAVVAENTFDEMRYKEVCAYAGLVFESRSFRRKCATVARDPPEALSGRLTREQVLELVFAGVPPAAVRRQHRAYASKNAVVQHSSLVASGVSRTEPPFTHHRAGTPRVVHHHAARGSPADAEAVKEAEGADSHATRGNLSADHIRMLFNRCDTSKCGRVSIADVAAVFPSVPRATLAELFLRHTDEATAARRADVNSVRDCSVWRLLALAHVPRLDTLRNVKLTPPLTLSNLTSHWATLRPQLAAVPALSMQAIERVDAVVLLLRRYGPVAVAKYPWRPTGGGTGRGGGTGAEEPLVQYTIEMELTRDTEGNLRDPPVDPYSARLSLEGFTRMLDVPANVAQWGGASSGTLGSAPSAPAAVAALPPGFQPHPTPVPPVGGSSARLVRHRTMASTHRLPTRAATSFLTTGGSALSLRGTLGDSLQHQQHAGLSFAGPALEDDGNPSEISSISAATSIVSAVPEEDDEREALTAPHRVGPAMGTSAQVSSSSTACAARRPQRPRTAPANRPVAHQCSPNVGARGAPRFSCRPPPIDTFAPDAGRNTPSLHLGDLSRALRPPPPSCHKLKEEVAPQPPSKSLVERLQQEEREHTDFGTLLERHGRLRHYDLRASSVGAVILTPRSPKSQDETGLLQSSRPRSPAESHLRCTRNDGVALADGSVACGVEAHDSSKRFCRHAAARTTSPGPLQTQPQRSPDPAPPRKRPAARSRATRSGHPRPAASASRLGRPTTHPPLAEPRGWVLV